MENRNFKFTIPEIKKLLNTTGIGSKQILKERFDNITNDDLFDLIHSARLLLNLNSIEDEKLLKMVKEADQLNV